MLRSVFAVIVVALVILGLVYVFDIIYGALATARHMIAVSTNTTEDTSYSTMSIQYVSKISTIIVLIIIGIFIVYSIHTKKR